MMNPTSVSQTINAAIVNISGRQRMLSQRAAMLSLMLTYSSKLSEHNQLRQELQAVTDLLEQSHAGLLQGNVQLNLPGNPSAAVQTLYFEPPFQVDQRLCNYVSALRNFLQQHKHNALLSGAPLLHAITDAAATQLLPGLDAIVSQYQKESDAQQAAIEEQRRQAAEKEAFLFRQAQERSQQLKQAKEKADAANQAKSRFLANMSHELRTPLNAVLGFSQLMARDQNLTSDQRKTLNIINRSGTHLLNLINNVLRISKIEAGKVELNLKSFDLLNLLDTLYEMFYLQAKSKAISLEFYRSAYIPNYVRGDEEKIRQILINLISNAIKFTPHGQVRLRVERELVQNSIAVGHELEENALTLKFMVEDSGDGIAPGELDKLFEVFSQTSTGQESAQGTGLGLAISRQFARLMGGDISITSEVNRGTTAYVKVPVTEMTMIEAADTHDSKVIGLAPNQPDYRILIVEDRPENRQLLVQYMEMVGFKVLTAQNGQEAIECWMTWNPHFIWMDWKMPVMNGEDATRKIRKLEDNSKDRTIIVALSASVLEETEAETLDAGCDDFVYKPFRESKLFEKLEQYLNVRYIYKPSVESSPADINDGAMLNQGKIKEQMRQLSKELLFQLNQSAVLLEEEKIRQHIREISIHQPNLAEQLNHLLQTLRLDRIAELAHGAMLQTDVK